MTTHIASVSLWNAAFCETMIRAAEAVGFTWNSNCLRVSDISPRLFEHIQADVVGRIVPNVHELWPSFECNALSNLLVTKQVGTVGLTSPDHDGRERIGSVRLNTGYRGGNLVFASQNYHDGYEPVGELFVWSPKDIRHHGTEPVDHGVKYTVMMWFELPLLP